MTLHEFGKLLKTKRSRSGQEVVLGLLGREELQRKLQEQRVRVCESLKQVGPTPGAWDSFFPPRIPK